MKKLLLLFVFAITLSCSTPEKERVAGLDCDCDVSYYLYTPNVGGMGGNYVYLFSNPIEFDCRTQEHGFYYPVSNINYNYAKVECE